MLRMLRRSSIVSLECFLLALALVAQGVAHPVTLILPKPAPVQLPLHRFSRHVPAKKPCKQLTNILFVAEHGINKIERFDDPFQYAAQLVANSTNSSAAINDPGGMVVHRNTLYVANGAGQNILEFSLCGNAPIKIIPDTHGTISEVPNDIAVSTAGNIYTANASGNVTTFTALGALHSILLAPSASRGDGIAIDSQGNCFFAYETTSSGPGAIVEFFYNPTTGFCEGPPSPVSLFKMGGGTPDPLIRPSQVRIDCLDDLIQNDYILSTTKTYAWEGPTAVPPPPPPYNYDWIAPGAVATGSNPHIVGLALRGNEKILNVADDFDGIVYRYSYPSYTPLQTLTGGLAPHITGVASWPAPPL